MGGGGQRETRAMGELVRLMGAKEAQEGIGERQEDTFLDPLV